MVDSTGGNELVECSQVPLINDLLFPISRSWPFDYMKHQIRNSRNHEEVDLVGSRCITRNSPALS